MEVFFTGCVTTTVDGVFPPLASIDRFKVVDTVGVIDLAERVGLEPPTSRWTRCATPTRATGTSTWSAAPARRWGVLEHYQQRLDRIITGPLHS